MWAVFTLLVLQGPDKGQRFELPDEPIVIGRESRHLPLTDNTVSRRHCELTYRDEILLLTDLGSANGTFINGLRLNSPQAVRVGDQLRIGRTLMVFGTAPGSGMMGGKTRGGEVELAGAESGMDSAIMHTVGANDDSLVLAVPDPSAAAVSNLQILYQLGSALNASFDVRQAMGITMDLVFEHVKAERGLILLKNEGTGELETVVVRQRSEKKEAGDGKPPAIQASRTIINHVTSSGEGVLSSNAMLDKRFAKGKSVHDLGIRSAMCVPIKARRLSAGSEEKGEAVFEVLGVLYIDTSVKNFTYSPDQLRLLSAIGMQAGMAVQNAKLYQAGIRAERLAAIGETTAALSHSIKNILQALRGGADVVEMGLGSGNVSQANKGWGIVNRNLDKIYSLTMNLLAYSRPRTPEVELVNPKKVIEDVVETVAGNAREKGVMVLADADADQPPVPMDVDGIHQVLMNLVGNALDAVETGKGLIKVVSKYDEAKDEAVIEVLDNGPGIAPTMEKHLFELFHSTKGNRGTGLGLAVSRKIVEEHGGTIAASMPTQGPNQEQQTGTLFTVRLPMKRLNDAGDLSGTSGQGTT